MPTSAPVGIRRTADARTYLSRNRLVAPRVSRIRSERAAADILVDTSPTS